MLTKLGSFTQHNALVPLVIFLLIFCYFKIVKYAKKHQKALQPSRSLFQAMIGSAM